MCKEKSEDIIITEDEYVILNPNNEMVKALNDTFESANKHPGLMPVLRIEGMPGCGKTSIMFAWLRKNKVVNKFETSINTTKNINGPKSEKSNLSYMVASEDWFNDMVTYGDDYLYTLHRGKVGSLNKENCIKHHLNPKSLIESTNDSELIFSKQIIDAIDENTILVFDDYDRFDFKIIESFCSLIKKCEATIIDDSGNKVKKKINCLMIIVIIDVTNSKISYLEEKGLLF